MSFYYQHQDCSREMSDYYVNTPQVSQLRNQAPRYIQLNWDDTLDPSRAIIEFYRYSSIVPLQTDKTITARGTWNFYPVTSPDLVAPISHVVACPANVQKFRIRLDYNGPYVTNFAPIQNNEGYFYSRGQIYRIYDI